MTKLKRNYTKTVELLVELASLQTSFGTWDEAIKITNSCVNAIEYVIITWIEYTLACIIAELGERVRRVIQVKENTGEEKDPQGKA